VSPSQSLRLPTRRHPSLIGLGQQAALTYACSEYGRADTAKLMMPHLPVLTPGQAIQQAAMEGLFLIRDRCTSPAHRPCSPRGMPAATAAPSPNTPPLFPA